MRPMPGTPTNVGDLRSNTLVTFSDQVASIVNAEALALTNAGVNKIILSSHLQNTANERHLVTLVKNVDIVISGGADDLLANPLDSLVLITPGPATPVGPYRDGAERHPRTL